jgi:hypothetical protein
VIDPICRFVDYVDTLGDFLKQGGDFFSVVNIRRVMVEEHLRIVACSFCDRHRFEPVLKLQGIYDKTPY